MNNFTVALDQVQSNFNSFGYLAVFAALAIWLVYRAAPEFHRLKLPEITIGFPCFLFVVSLAIRAFCLGYESLWYDEAFTGVIARLPLDQMISATASDVHPPAFYILEWAAIRIWGASEEGLRMLPALASAGAAVLVYQLAEDHLDRRGALWAWALATFAPGLLYYGQEARAYSLLALLVLVALWAARRGRWLAYIAALALALWTHNYALLYAAALVLAALVTGNRRQLIATAGAGLLYLPWLPVLYNQISGVSSGYWIPDLLPGRALVEPYLTLITGYRMPGAVTLAALGAFLALTVAGIVELWRLESLRIHADLLILAFFPALAAICVSVVITPVYLPRGLIPSAYIVLILCAGWLVAHQNQAIVSLSIIGIIISVLWFYLPAQNSRDDIRGAVDQLAIRAGDTVYHADEQSYILFRYYAPEADHVLADYPAGLSHGLSSGTRQALGVIQSAEPVGRYLVLATGTGRSNVQYQLVEDLLRLAGDPILTLYENSTQWGRVYEFRDHSS